jgi:hypothetical protein
MEGKVMKTIPDIRCGKMTKEKSMVLDDTYSETVTFASQCMYCEKLLNDGECPAYPDGIPMDLWTAKRKDCTFFEKVKEIKK